VEALARGVGVSSGHLSREFRRAYGETPYSYLMARRIERAMALLRGGAPCVDRGSPGSRRPRSSCTPRLPTPASVRAGDVDVLQPTDQPWGCVTSHCAIPLAT
jgi:hypothetical protein